LIDIFNVYRMLKISIIKDIVYTGRLTVNEEKEQLQVPRNKSYK